MIRFDALLVTLLIVLAAACGLGVISAQHEARKLRSALEREQIRAQNLEVEWGRLQLEQSTLAAPRRVEGIARKRLGMISPDAGQIIVLEGGAP
ncbi:MAG: cell division protein FtsL [Betaproteobacteria bacterium]|jgi:cell division protein FtsL|nr:cell division protein FtsL [Betaproteobacteria bacterium]